MEAILDAYSTQQAQAVRSAQQRVQQLQRAQQQQQQQQQQQMIIALLQQQAAASQLQALEQKGGARYGQVDQVQVHSLLEMQALLQAPQQRALQYAANQQNPWKYNSEENEPAVHIWRGFGQSKVPPGAFLQEDGTLITTECSQIIVNHGGKITNIGAHVANLGGECTNIRGRTDNFFGTVHNAEGVVVNNGGHVNNLRGYVENHQGAVANYHGDVRNVKGDVQNEAGRVHNEGGRVLNDRGTVASFGGLVDNYHGDVAGISSSVQNRGGVVHGYACDISNVRGVVANENGNCINMQGMVDNRNGFVENYEGYVRNNSPEPAPSSTAQGVGQGHALYQSMAHSLSTFPLLTDQPSNSVHEPQQVQAGRALAMAASHRGDFLRGSPPPMASSHKELPRTWNAFENMPSSPAHMAGVGNAGVRDLTESLKALYLQGAWAQHAIPSSVGLAGSPPSTAYGRMSLGFSSSPSGHNEVIGCLVFVLLPHLASHQSCLD